MDATTRHDEIERLFAAFTEAFPTFLGENVVRLYAIPFMSVQADGTATVYQTQEQLGQYFQAVLDGYRGQGRRACRFMDLSVKDLGANAALATVSWELTGPGDDVVSRWRESYHLILEQGRWKIRVSTDHA